MADPKSATLELCLQAVSGADADQIDRETRQLRSELRELDLGSVELSTGEAPAGTKAIDGLVLGSLVMEVLPNAISPLIEFLKSWTLRRNGRTVKVKAVLRDRSVEMEFDPATVSPKEVKSLVNSIVKELGRTGE